MKEIARRRPVDGVAARVTSAGPKGYESSKVILQTCQPEPPAMRDIPAGVPNLIGCTNGLLTVIGLSVRKGGAAGNTSRWVCRCACGYYTERTSKAVRYWSRASSGDFTDRCDRCRQVFYLRRRSEYDQLGFNPDEQQR